MKGEDVLNELISRIPALESCKQEISDGAEAIIECFEMHGKLLICGNGGSCADAEHMVGELVKSFEKKSSLPEEFKKRLQAASVDRGTYLADHLEHSLPAISLCSQSSLISAISNDMGAALVFAQQVAAYGRKGDVLFAISTSGSSQNVVDAAITAKAKGMLIIGLTGQHGGMVKQYCDTCICVPSSTTAKTQEYHLPVYHTLCRIIENRFF